MVDFPVTPETIAKAKAAQQQERDACYTMTGVLIRSDGTIDLGHITCLDCGWQGRGYELKAQACPVCDGRCADA